MGIFDTVFGGSKAAPANNASAASTPTTQPQTPTTPGQPAQQVTQPATPGNNQPAAPESPLDQYTKLWDNTDTPTPPNASQLFNIDQGKLVEAVKQMNFTPQISADTLQAIQQGGDAAVQAFAASLNQTAQATYAQSVLAATKIVEQALDKAQKSYDQRIPQIVKQFQVSDNLRTENPALSNPAVQPLITAMEQQFTQKFPNASASEITTMAKNYIATVADVFKPQQQQQQEKQDYNGTDFSAWIQ